MRIPPSLMGKGIMLPFVTLILLWTQFGSGASTPSVAVLSSSSFTLEEEYLAVRKVLGNATFPFTNISSFPPILLFLHASFTYMNHSIYTLHQSSFPSSSTAALFSSSSSASSSSSSTDHIPTVYENKQKIQIEDDYYAGISALAQLNKWSNNPVMTECYGKAYVWLRNTERSNKYYRGVYSKDIPQAIMAIDILSSQSAIAVGLSRDLVVLQEAFKKLYRYITYYQSSKTKLLSYLTLHLSTVTMIIDTLSHPQYFRTHHPLAFLHVGTPSPVSSSSPSSSPPNNTDNKNSNISSSSSSTLPLTMQQRRNLVNFLNQLDTTIVHSIFVTETFDNFASIAEAIYQRANKSIHMCAERWLNQKQYEISQGIAVPHPVVTPHAHTVVGSDTEEAFINHLVKSQSEKKFSKPNNPRHSKSSSSRRASSSSKGSSTNPSSANTSPPDTPRATDPTTILSVTEDALLAAERMVVSVESSGGFFNTGLDTIEYGITPYIYNLCSLRSVLLYTDPTIETESLSGLPFRSSIYPNILNHLPSDFKFRPVYKLSSEYCGILHKVWDNYVPSLEEDGSEAEEIRMEAKSGASLTNNVTMYRILNWWRNMTNLSSPFEGCSLSSAEKTEDTKNEGEVYYRTWWECFCNETFRALSDTNGNGSVKVHPTTGETVFRTRDTYASCLGEVITTRLTSEIVNNLQIVYKSHDKELTGESSFSAVTGNSIPQSPQATTRENPSEADVRFS